jgi:hypothetical protein
MKLNKEGTQNDRKKEIKERRRNKTGKAYSLEYTNFPKAFFFH